MSESNGSGLAVVDPAAAAIAPGGRTVIMQRVLDEERDIRRMLAQYVKGQMTEGVDYGVIPGTPKPSLLKPGAEKLVSLFRCTPKFALVKVVEDFDAGLFSYVFRVRLVSRDSGEVLAEGYGSANSREGRYRWREGQRLCPHCQAAAIIKGKAEFGGGWLCFAKKGGCGAKFADKAPEIVGQQLGRVENDDIATLANTILKMAKKRALVDGTIALAHCSDMFTQDVEDLADVRHAEPPHPAEEPPAQGRKSAPVQASAREAKAPPPSDAAKGVRIWMSRAREVLGSTEAIRTFCLQRIDRPSAQWTSADLARMTAELDAEHLARTEDAP